MISARDKAIDEQLSQRTEQRLREAIASIVEEDVPGWNFLTIPYRQDLVRALRKAASDINQRRFLANRARS